MVFGYRRDSQGSAEPGTTTRTESLGNRIIEGVSATGSRTVTTIAAGAVGNELPIDVVDERWYSTELEVQVYTRHVDPRYGETTYRLVNIVRAEPDAQLFEIPGDYRLDEPTARREILRIEK